MATADIPLTPPLHAPLEPGRSSDFRIIVPVSAAHFVSHYYQLVLPPLFAFIRADYQVSYTELGFAIAVFNIVSAVLQPPAGFLVDRFGARVALIAALLLGALAYAVTAAVPSFWVLVAMMALVGLANSLYHPADYALLGQCVSPARKGQAYSIHTFSGMLGTAAAPVSLLFMQAIWGWRGALYGAALVGVVVTIYIIFQPALSVTPQRHAEPANAVPSSSTGWRLLMTMPILSNFAFFIFLAVTSTGIQFYSVVALNALYGTPLAIANTALSAFLIVMAIGVLAGGVAAGMTARHGMVAAGGLLIAGLAYLLIGVVELGTVTLIIAMATAGFFTGITMPSRDLLVSESTPPGAFGAVFGFVSTGFNVGAIAGPLVFGALMDHNSPRLVFLIAAAFTVISVITVMSRPKARGFA